MNDILLFYLYTSRMAGTEKIQSGISDDILKLKTYTIDPYIFIISNWLIVFEIPEISMSLTEDLKKDYQDVIKLIKDPKQGYGPFPLTEELLRDIYLFFGFIGRWWCEFAGLSDIKGEDIFKGDEDIPFWAAVDSKFLLAYYGKKYRKPAISYKNPPGLPLFPWNNIINDEDIFSLYFEGLEKKSGVKSQLEHEYPSKIKKHTPWKWQHKAINQIIRDLKKENKGKINGDTIRAIIVLSQMNAHIWYNESQVRKGEKGSDNLMLTHGLNGIRNTAINKIMEVVGGRKDYKVDCIAAEFKDWEVSWEE